MKSIFWLIFTLILLSMPAQSDSTFLASCKVSFDIEEDTIVNIQKQNYSCRFLEDTKNQLYESFNQKNHTLIVSQISNLEKLHIDRLEQLVEAENYNEEHAKLFKSIIYKLRAGVGLKACLPTMGITCLDAAYSFGKATSLQFEAAQSYGKKAKLIKQLRAKTHQLKQSLDNNKKKLPTGYQYAIKSFNHYCAVIKTSCIKN